MLNGKPLIGFLGYVLPFGQMSLWGISLPQMHWFITEIVFISYTYVFYTLGWIFITIYLGSNSRKKGQLAIRLPAEARVGPHNKDILSIFTGTLLGDAHAERRVMGFGTRLSISQESNRAEYLLYLHGLIANLGYCNPNVPKIQSRMGTAGKIRYVLRFHTYTYSSLNFLHDLWYSPADDKFGNYIKKVPNNIAEFLSPLALAIWIMDDGGRAGYGLKLSTNSFSFADNTRLVQVIHDLYGIEASVQSAGVPDQYQIYIWSNSMPVLRDLVRPHMVSSMLYKLGE